MQQSMTTSWIDLIHVLPVEERIKLLTQLQESVPLTYALRALFRSENNAWHSYSLTVKTDKKCKEVLAERVIASQPGQLLVMDDQFHTILLVSDDYSGDVSIEASSNELPNARTAAERLAALFPPRPALDPDIVYTKFWSIGGGEGAYVGRDIKIPQWGGITDNYPPPVLSGLDALFTRGIPEKGDNGGLILWHGPPGTGKTFAIRALLGRWREWCDGSYIVDPEALLGRANYMLRVALGDGDQVDLSGQKPRVRWKLIVIEDADEFLTADAKERTGQAVSRLLNLTDGLVGQGLNLMVLITTNEPIERIHPAVRRVGRCLADVQFTPFDAPGAQAWLANHGHIWVPRTPMTLAEMYSKLTAFSKITVATQSGKMGFNLEEN